MQHPTVAEINKDIEERFGKRQGAAIGRFFDNWIRYEEQQSAAVSWPAATRARTILQAKLATHELDISLGEFHVGNRVLGSGEPDLGRRVPEPRRHVHGNGIWHYLADAIRGNESGDTIKIAEALLSMDIDYSRRNRAGVSPLAKMLTPNPKWKSINALVQTGHLSVADLERAIGEGDQGRRRKWKDDQ